MPGQVKFCLLKNSGYRKRSERDYKGWVEDKNKYFCHIKLKTIQTTTQCVCYMISVIVFINYFVDLTLD